MIQLFRLVLFINYFLLFSHVLHAQDDRSKYPEFLQNSFFSVNLGYISYPFSAAQLEKGFTVESIETPHLAARVFLFGHHFNRYLSAEVSYMRPVKYVRYNSINNDGAVHTLWMHYGSLTLTGRLPLHKKLSLAGSAGIGVVSRRGMYINDVAAVHEANYATITGGVGLEYHLNKKFDLLATAAFYPASNKYRQPTTTYLSAGFRYNMRPPTVANNAAVDTKKYHFPKNILQLGYATNQFGYGANDFFSKKLVMFWGGGIEVRKGFAVNYKRNIYHTKKIFALDIGVGAGFWQTAKNNQSFFTLSAYPIFRFNVLRTKPFDTYVMYSVAGPTFISADKLDGLDAGRSFTFQDFMGLGFFAGKNRKLNFEVNINHYSNGNIFTQNAGLKIPLTFNLGYTF